jgi:hypothetical protein
MEVHGVWSGRIGSLLQRSRREFVQSRVLWGMIRGGEIFSKNVVLSLLRVERLGDRPLVSLVVMGWVWVTDELEALFLRVDEGLRELIAEAVKGWRSKAA